MNYLNTINNLVWDTNIRWRIFDFTAKLIWADCVKGEIAVIVASPDFVRAGRKFLLFGVGFGVNFCEHFAYGGGPLWFYI